MANLDLSKTEWTLREVCGVLGVLVPRAKYYYLSGSLPIPAKRGPRQCWLFTVADIRILADRLGIELPAELASNDGGDDK